MPWSVEYHPALRIVETAYVGLLTRDDLRAAVAATIASCREQQTRLLLADCTALQGGHSFVDLYDAAAVVGSTTGLGVLREAVLVPAAPELLDSVRFWETTATNRGLQVRLFNDRAQAIAWLVS